MNPIDLEQIKTSYVFPPIPMRQFDWCAYMDGREEAGPYGWGRTEEEAVKDLTQEIEAIGGN